MSRTLSVFSSATVVEAEFHQFLADFGGSTVSSPGLPGLTIAFSEGESRVWAYGVEKALTGDFEPPSPAVRARLDGGARVRLDLALSHHPAAAALALRVARAFISRWPGVVELCSHAALSAAPIGNTLRLAAAAEFLGSEVVLAFRAAPRLDDLIDEMGGMVVGHDDAELLASSATALRELDGADFAPELDTIVGVLPANASDVWVLLRSFTVLRGHVGDILTPIVRQALGGMPTAAVRVVTGNQTTKHADVARACALSFARRVAGQVACATIGLFVLVLDADEVGVVLDSGAWEFVT